jgi:hypothetical protein
MCEQRPTKTTGAAALFNLGQDMGLAFRFLSGLTAFEGLNLPQKKKKTRNTL